MASNKRKNVDEELIREEYKKKTCGNVEFFNSPLCRDRDTGIQIGWRTYRRIIGDLYIPEYAGGQDRDYNKDKIIEAYKSGMKITDIHKSDICIFPNGVRMGINNVRRIIKTIDTYYGREYDLDREKLKSLYWNDGYELSDILKTEHVICRKSGKRISKSALTEIIKPTIYRQVDDVEIRRLYLEELKSLEWIRDYSEAAIDTRTGKCAGMGAIIRAIGRENIRKRGEVFGIGVDEDKVIKMYSEDGYTMLAIHQILGYSKERIRDILIRNDIEIRKNASKEEFIIRELLEELGFERIINHSSLVPFMEDGITPTYLVNDRILLKEINREIDILIPSLKIGIEVNGVYWHSNKEENYHLEKSLACKELGYNLLQYFCVDVEDEIDNIRHILTILLNKKEVLYEQYIPHWINEGEDILDFIDYYRVSPTGMPLDYHLTGYKGKIVENSTYLNLDKYSWENYHPPQLAKKKYGDVIFDVYNSGYSLVYRKKPV